MSPYTSQYDSNQDVRNQGSRRLTKVRVDTICTEQREQTKANTAHARTRSAVNSGRKLDLALLCLSL